MPNIERIPEDTFGARLAVVRQNMRWNVSEAAGECGIKAATWRLWEDTDSLPRNIFDVCSKISRRTGFKYEWLLMGGPLESPKGVRSRWSSHHVLRGVPTHPKNPKGLRKRVERPLPLFTQAADNR